MRRIDAVTNHESRLCDRENEKERNRDKNSGERERKREGERERERKREREDLDFQVRKCDDRIAEIKEIVSKCLGTVKNNAAVPRLLRF
jgi:hypothetical protein